MLDSVAQLNRVADREGIPNADVLLIALNSCGARSPLTKPRMRFRLHLDGCPDPVYLILSLGRDDSPFEIDSEELRLHGQRVGRVAGIEDDDAVLGYWRNDGRVLTLNSNARSQCVGCTFCPNTLEGASDPALDRRQLSSSLQALAAQSGMADLSRMETLTVCTGCFLYEDLALEHLSHVRAAMNDHGSLGTLQFLSSVLTTQEGLRAAAELGPFHLTLTAECFTQRRDLLKDSKASLSPDQMVTALAHARGLRITTDFTYIVGLDPMETAIEALADFVPVTSTFPRLQIYQAHTPLMDVHRTPGSETLEWHLEMRHHLERLFLRTGLRPQWWENYRSPWCFSFAGEPLDGAKV